MSDHSEIRNYFISRISTLFFLFVLTGYLLRTSKWKEYRKFFFLQFDTKFASK